VNNAGILNGAPLHEMSEAVWDQMIATNLRSVFLVTRAVLPQMLARGAGRIINVSSQLGQKGMPNHAHYAAAKGGVIAMTKSLAREVSPRGVRVNVISPGPVDTRMLAPVDEAQRSEIAARTLFDRLGTPEDIAAATLYLSCADSGWVTGEVLRVNGGALI
jgi:3-oxoacyl-[acyl-carrier protein] reductase